MFTSNFENRDGTESRLRGVIGTNVLASPAALHALARVPHVHGIVLWRDPFEAAAWILESTIGHVSSESIQERTAEIIRLFSAEALLTIAQQMPILLVSLEDLIVDPNGTLAQVMDFLGLQLQDIDFKMADNGPLNQSKSLC